MHPGVPSFRCPVHADGPPQGLTQSSSVTQGGKSVDLVVVVLAASWGDWTFLAAVCSTAARQIHPGFPSRICPVHPDGPPQGATQSS
ncbi:hypothetical protein, partial [Ralstonia pseudosolanacearum]|uniref:hypothetical protein n=1 Tax=Ralstonia pseudosolanacearum TaxID=1310165 RepID=UPI003CEDEDDC